MYTVLCTCQQVGVVPFNRTSVRERRRREVRARYGDAPCALQIPPDCRALGGHIDYTAPAGHPRSYEVDHIVTSVEAAALGWPPAQTDALDNLQPVCRQCNRAKSDGRRPPPQIRATVRNGRFR